MIHVHVEVAKSTRTVVVKISNIKGYRPKTNIIALILLNYSFDDN